MPVSDTPDSRGLVCHDKGGKSMEEISAERRDFSGEKTNRTCMNGSKRVTLFDSASESQKTVHACAVQLFLQPQSAESFRHVKGRLPGRLPGNMDTVGRRALDP